MIFRFHLPFPRRAFVAAAGLALVLSAPVGAQVPSRPTAAELQRQVEALGGPEEVRRRLTRSGMSQYEVRQRLAASGYDPSLLDDYLDPAAELAGAPDPAVDVLEALQALGVPPLRPDSAVRDTVGDTIPSAASMLPDSSAFEREASLRVFGLEVFSRRTTQFEPVHTGPVPDDYVLGPGDEIVLILTGDVEKAYQLPVTREGFIVIPQVGQVWVNGLTMAELRDRLYTELGRAYSGVRREGEPTTRFQASLGRVRTNEVFVTGQVVRPGKYLVSPVASFLNALYAAGGPTPDGSFRDVRIVRGGTAVQRVDLYAYLVGGDNMSDIVLRPGDVIHVPAHGDLVAIRGEVTQPGIYEVADGETLLDVIAFAGGLAIPASVNRARITRIVPPLDRTRPGVERTVLDVELTPLLRGEAEAPRLFSGDDVRIFRVRSEVRDVVSITGAVWHPCGVRGPGPVRTDSAAADSVVALDPEGPAACGFRFDPGMRLWDLIGRAGGLRPDAYTPRAHILRLDPADSVLSTVPVSLERRADGEPVENPRLQEFDVVEVLSRAEFEDSLTVTIAGEVRRPGTLAYREGMTLRDLVLLAGGLTPEADLTVEVARRAGGPGRSETSLADIHRVTVDSSYVVSELGMRLRPANPFADGAAPTHRDAERFELLPHDQVFVRHVPAYEPQRTVFLGGQVRYPGRYALEAKDERLSRLLARAGGATVVGYAPGFRLYRDGTLVNVELPAALSRPGGPDDPVLMPGDSMVLPEYNPVVVVRGAVNSPSSVLFRKGADLDYYVRNAGGYAENADPGKVHIRYANGSGEVRRKLLVFTSSPRPGPGCVITVPYRPEDQRFDLRGTISDVAQIATSLATLLIVLSRL